MRVSWVPIVSDSINKFISRSLEIYKHEIIDTLYFHYRNNKYIGVEIKFKRKFFLFIYMDKPGAQDVFTVANIKRHNAKYILEYVIRNIFQEDDA